MLRIFAPSRFSRSAGSLVTMIDDYRLSQSQPISFGQWLWLGYYVLGLALLTVFCGWLIGGVL